MFLWALIVSIGINIVMFIPAYIRKTDVLTDISYAVTFAVVAVYGFISSEQTLAQKLATAMVLLWAARLGMFLFMRILKMKKDARFDGMRDRFFAFLRFWLLQGATVYVVLLAAIALWSRQSTTITGLSVAGLVIWAVGLVLEAFADGQKFRFNNRKTTDVWIDEGVWRMSRHPNYLGEMMVWIGMCMFVFSSLNGAGRLVAVISPIYIISLLLFVSGVPLLEKSADKKWGSDKAYQRYKREVPAVVPSLRSIKRFLSR